MELQEKEDKDQKCIRKLIRKDSQITGDSTRKAIYIRGQANAFCKKKIHELSLFSDITHQNITFTCRNQT